MRPGRVMIAHKTATTSGMIWRSATATRRIRTRRQRSWSRWRWSSSPSTHRP